MSNYYLSREAWAAQERAPTEVCDWDNLRLARTCHAMPMWRRSRRRPRRWHVSIRMKAGPCEPRSKPRHQSTPVIPVTLYRRGTSAFRTPRQPSKPCSAP